MKFIARIVIASAFLAGAHGFWPWSPRQSTQDPHRKLWDKFNALREEVWNAPHHWHFPTGMKLPKKAVLDKLDEMSNAVWGPLYTPQHVTQMGQMSQIFSQSSLQKDGLFVQFVHRNGKDTLDVTSPDFSNVNDLQLLNEMRTSVGLPSVQELGSAEIRHHLQEAPRKFLQKTDCRDNLCVTYTFSNGKEQLRLEGDVPEDFDRKTFIQTYRDYFGLKASDIPLLEEEAKEEFDAAPIKSEHPEDASPDPTDKKV